MDKQATPKEGLAVVFVAERMQMTFRTSSSFIIVYSSFILRSSASVVLFPLKRVYFQKIGTSHLIC